MDNISNLGIKEILDKIDSGGKHPHRRHSPHSRSRPFPPHHRCGTRRNDRKEDALPRTPFIRLWEAVLLKGVVVNCENIGFGQLGAGGGRGGGGRRRAACRIYDEL